MLKYTDYSTITHKNVHILY